MSPYRKPGVAHGPWSRLRQAARRAWTLVTDPGRFSAERYAGSSKMYLSAVRPETWRQDVGPDIETAPRLAEDPTRQYGGVQAPMLGQPGRARLITYRKSHGLPVVTLLEGAMVGKLDDFQFDLSTRRIYGYRLRGSGVFSRSGGVAAAKLQRIGRDVAFVGEEAEIEWKSGSGRHNQEGRAWASQYRGIRVMSRSGALLGAVEDFVFDPVADQVVALFVDNNRVVDLDDDVATGPAAVIVDDPASLRELPPEDRAAEEWWKRLKRKNKAEDKVALPAPAAPPPEPAAPADEESDF